jgi:hypothetical protein
MAFMIETDSRATIEVVCSKDGCLEMTPELFANYLEDVSDRGRLHFKPGFGYEDCTRFVMRKVLPFKAAQRVVDQQVQATVKDKQVETRLSLKYMLEEVRCALVDIKGPGLQFKKGSDGLADEELVAGIYAAGVLGELHNAWSSATKGSGEMAQKK